MKCLTKHLYNYAWSLSQSNKLEALKIVHYGYDLCNVKNNNKNIMGYERAVVVYSCLFILINKKPIEEGDCFYF